MEAVDGGKSFKSRRVATTASPAVRPFDTRVRAWLDGVLMRYR